MQKRSNERDLAIQQGSKTYNGNSCKKCNTTEKYVSSYGCVKCNIKTNSHKLYNDELMKSYRTKEKTNRRLSVWRNKNKDKVAEQYQRRRLLKYNISQKDFDVLLEEQDYKCAICTKELSEKFTVDHSHKTGKVRGLLCYKCNNGIGLLCDSTDILNKAIEYLNERK